MIKKTYYVKSRIKLRKVDNVLFKLIKTEINEIYSLAINHSLYDRFVKVQKITSIKNKTIDVITKLLENKITESAYIERTLIQEMSINIDKMIIEDLFKLGLNKNGKI